MDVQTVGATAAAPQATAAPVMGARPDSSDAGTTAGDGHRSLSDTIGKLFGDPSQPQAVNVNVSYRVSEHPSQIVTVFSDPTTGEEIAQFPADLLIQIAQFFDKQSGVTLDRTA